MTHGDSNGRPIEGDDQTVPAITGSHHEISRRQLLAYAGAAGTVALLPGLLTACGSSSSSPTDELTIVVPQMPRIFDVTRVDLPNGATILPALEPILVADPASGKPLANIAESFRQLDETTFEFVVRENVTFWDGSPLAASDVVFSMSLHADKASQSDLFSTWSGTDITASGNTITVRLQKPNLNFIYGVTQTGVVQEKFWSQNAGKVGTPETLNLGTGPLQLTSFVPEQSADFDRYESYWGDKASMKVLHMKTIGDENTALTATRSGEVTGTFAITAGRLREYEGLSNVNTSVAPDPSVVTVFFNPSLSPFDDIHVRRAIALSIDKAGINDSVYGGATTIAKSLVPPFLLEQLIPTDQVDAFLAPLEIPFDPEKAKAELAKSKVPDGFEYDLITASYDPDTLQDALALADSVKDLGITLNVKEIPPGQYDDAVFFPETKTEPMGLVNFGPTAFTPVNVPIATLSPDNIPPKGYTNLAAFDSPEAGQICNELNQLGLSTDAGKAAQLLQQLLAINTKEVIYAPIVFEEQILALDTAYTYRDFTAAWNLSPWYRQLQPA